MSSVADLTNRASAIYLLGALDTQRLHLSVMQLATSPS